MALTQLTDAVVPEVFSTYMIEKTMEKAGVFTSGLLVPDAYMAQQMSGGGRLFQHPFWNDLGTEDSSIATDDPSDELVLGKIGAAKMQFVRQFRTRGWSSANLVSQLAGSDPQMAIVGLVSDYWAREFNKLTVATLNGIVNKNIASNGGDMVFSAGVGVGGATPLEGISGEAVLETKQTMGDAAEALKIIVMHSRIYTNLQQQNLIVTIPNQRGEVAFETYLNYRVVVADTAPVNGGVYTCYLTAPGVMGWCEKPPIKPVETKSEPGQGNGAGVEKLYTRRQFAIHPYGWNWKDTDCVLEFPTTAELQSVTNWERKVPERKQVPMAVLLCTAD